MYTYLMLSFGSRLTFCILTVPLTVHLASPSWVVSVRPSGGQGTEMPILTRQLGKYRYLFRICFISILISLKHYLGIPFFQILWLETCDCWWPAILFFNIRSLSRSRRCLPCLPCISWEAPWLLAPAAQSPVVTSWSVPTIGAASRTSWISSGLEIPGDPWCIGLQHAILWVVQDSTKPSAVWKFHAI